MTLRYDTRSRVGQSVKNWINPSLDIEYLIIAGGGAAVRVVVLTLVLVAVQVAIGHP